MSRYLIPVGVVWVVLSLIIGLIIVMTPPSRQGLAQTSASNRSATHTPTEDVSPPAAANTSNGTVKTKAFVAGTSDAVTRASVKVAK